MEEHPSPPAATPAEEPSVEPARSTALDDEDDAPTRLEALGYWLERKQWLPLVLFVVGAAALLLDRRLGLVAMGAAVILAGMVPVITGRYRGPLGTLSGLGARMRGVVSVVIGIFIVSLGLAL